MNNIASITRYLRGSVGPDPVPTDLHPLTRQICAVERVLQVSATGLWAAGAEEEPAAAAEKKYVTDPSTGKVVVAPAVP